MNIISAKGQFQGFVQKTKQWSQIKNDLGKNEKRIFKDSHSLSADNQTRKLDLKKWAGNSPNCTSERFCAKGKADSQQPNTWTDCQVSSRCLLGDWRPPWGQGPKQTSRAHWNSLFMCLVVDCRLSLLHKISHWYSLAGSPPSF